MSETLPKLKVRVLGNFSMTYGDEPMRFGRNSKTKAMQLLQVLIYHGDQGIHRQQLLEYLYGREELSDVANNLRVTVHRLKKVLEDMNFPPHDYIRISKGIYYWDSPMETVIDARQFALLADQAKREENENKQIALLKDACNMYAGDFLPDISGEDWVVIESVRYKNLYSEALQKLCRMLMNRGEYQETLKLCAHACELYPFDEWQTIRIECFIAMNQYKEAMREYEDTVELLFEELGVAPSENMLQQFERMSSQINSTQSDISNIKNRLKEEEEEKGAYYCSLPSFRDSYRLVSRIIERNGQSVYLMLCTITNGKGQPIMNEAKRDVLANQLFDSIKHSLRRGDSFTKYSPAQFLVLLVGTNKENCSIIYDRIRKYFSRDHKTWANYLEFYVASVTDIEQKKAQLRFDGKDAVWDLAERK